LKFNFDKQTDLPGDKNPCEAIVEFRRETIKIYNSVCGIVADRATWNRIAKRFLCNKNSAPMSRSFLLQKNSNVRNSQGKQMLGKSPRSINRSIDPRWVH